MAINILLVQLSIIWSKNTFQIVFLFPSVKCISVFLFTWTTHLELQCK